MELYDKYWKRIYLDDVPDFEHIDLYKYFIHIKKTDIANIKNAIKISKKKIWSIRINKIKNIFNNK